MFFEKFGYFCLKKGGAPLKAAPPVKTPLGPTARSFKISDSFHNIDLKSNKIWDQTDHIYIVKG